MSGKNPFGEFLEHFDRALAGKSISIPLTDDPVSMRQMRLASKINIRKRTYMVLMGASGGGKTSFVDTLFVLNQYLRWFRGKEEHKTDPYWLYHSMERTNADKLAKWTSYLLYIKYGITCSSSTLFCETDKLYDIRKKTHKIVINRKTGETKEVSYEYLVKELQPFFEKMFSRVNIIAGTASPSQVFERSREVLMQTGTHIYCDQKQLYINDQLIDTSPEDWLEDASGERKQFFTERSFYGKTFKIYENDNRYIEKNTDQIFYNIVDHIGKVEAEVGVNDPKKIVDKHSSNQSKLRDIYQAVPIDITQLNRDAYAKDRTGRYIVIEPDASHMYGSSQPEQNCDLLLTMINPQKLNEELYRDYEIPRMLCRTGGHNRFRALKILKATSGTEGFVTGFYFAGESGLIHELPKAEDMTDSMYETISNSTYPQHSGKILKELY